MEPSDLLERKLREARLAYSGAISIDLHILSSISKPALSTMFTIACRGKSPSPCESRARHHSMTEPTARFLSLLRASLTTGRAHLQTTKGGMPERSPESCGWRLESQNLKSQGDCIGWVDGENLYLEPTAAYRVIQMMVRDMSEP